MCRYWLKMIGTNDDPCREEFVQNHVGSRGRHRMTRMRPGDMMILYAVGRTNPLFAVARVTSAVHPSGNPGWPYQVGITCEARLPVGGGVTIEEADFRPSRKGAIQRGHSYIELDLCEYQRAADLLTQASGVATGV